MEAAKILESALNECYHAGYSVSINRTPSMRGEYIAILVQGMDFDIAANELKPADVGGAGGDAPSGAVAAS